MQIEIEKRLSIYIGPDPMHGARLGVFVGFGFREDAEPGETIWRHYWQWSSRSLPRIIWCGRRPIGVRAFGRTRLWIN